MPQPKETEFLMWWADVRDTVVGERGFIRGRLYRSYRGDTEYNFISIAQWEDELYAHDSEDTIRTRNARLAELGVQTTGGLFSFSKYSAIPLR